MGFRRSALSSIAAFVLFGCGVGATLAWLGREAATCLLLIFLAVWTGAAWIWNIRPAIAARAPFLTIALEAAQAEVRVLANLLDQAPAPMLTLHADGDVRAANRAARRLFATEGRLLDPQPALLEAFSRSGGEAQRLTITLGVGTRRKSYAMSATDFVGPRGVRRLAVLLDIEPDLKVAEATALRDLSGILNHELMNGLTPIASLAASAFELLGEPGFVGADEARRAISTLARRSEGLSRFVSAYRTLAQLPPPVRRPTSLSALLDEAAVLFRARWSNSSVALSVIQPDPDVICELDEEQLIRVLGNLLTNAAEALINAGVNRPHVKMEGRAEYGGVVIVVSDNGPGVPCADWDRIFKPFQTTKAAGAGVGLSLARQIAKSHGGDLTVEVSSAGGAAFELRVC